MKKPVSLSLMFLVAIAFIHAQSPINKDAVGYYDAELFKVGYNMLGGLNLSYQGQNSSVFFGVPDSYKIALGKYPDTRLLLDSYSGLNLAGNILVWGGLGLTLAAYIPLVNASTSTTGTNSSAYQTAMYLAIGGLVSELIGVFVLPASFERIVNAVNTFNRHKMEEYSQ